MGEEPTMTDRFATLPLILVGPTLQRTEPTSVAVWVVLQQPRRVTLRVYDTSQQGRQVGQVRMQGTRSTIAFGQAMHGVVVTAMGLSAEPLQWGAVYAYDLEFHDMTTDVSTASDPSETLNQALCSPAFPTVTISYFDHQLPTFALPPEKLEQLRLVHGSCRKPHGDGSDALTILDDLIQTAIATDQPRPHQLFLTGDQIYGDDVADPLLWVATQLGQELLGWQESLPLQSAPLTPTGVTPEQLPPGQRSPLATHQAGLTAGLLKKSHKVTSHLFGLGEFYAIYLLAWSPICWVTAFPQGKDYWGRSRAKRSAAKQWDREVRDIQAFISTLWKVRRAIANVPMYCIFDDHDVSDDWYLNQAWCLRVLGKPLGRRVVQNALLAYAVFQGWGNTPSQFALGSRGEQLLQAAQQWSASHGTDGAAWETVRRLLGIPAIDPATGLPKFQPDGEMLILDRDPEAIPWHYTLQSPCHDVIILDSRTWRGYPADEKPIAPPMLLSPTAFKQQLQQPLQTSLNYRPDRASPSGSRSRPHMTFVVAPTNLFGLQAIDWIQHWHLRRNQVYSSDVGDAWNIRLSTLAQLLTTLFAHRDSIVILSGDIHYGAAVSLDYYPLPASEQSRRQLVQLTSSSLKNEEFLTRLLQTRLKRWLLPERDRVWVGWHHPVDMQSVPTFPLRSPLPDQPPPDWYCQLSWLLPQRSHPLGRSAPQDSLAVSHPSLGQRYQILAARLIAPLSRWFQQGSEVIGRNNLGFIQVHVDVAHQHYQVTQDLYWRQPSYPQNLVYSRFCTSTPQIEREAVDDNA